MPIIKLNSCPIEKHYDEKNESTSGFMCQDSIKIASTEDGISNPTGSSHCHKEESYGFDNLFSNRSKNFSHRNEYF